MPINLHCKTIWYNVLINCNDKFICIIIGWSIKWMNYEYYAINCGITRIVYKIITMNNGQSNDWHTIIVHMYRLNVEYCE